MSCACDSAFICAWCCDIDPEAYQGRPRFMSSILMSMPGVTAETRWRLHLEYWRQRDDYRFGTMIQRRVDDGGFDP